MKGAVPRAWTVPLGRCHANMPTGMTFSPGPHLNSLRLPPQLQRIPLTIVLRTCPCPCPSSPPQPQSSPIPWARATLPRVRTVRRVSPYPGAPTCAHHPVQPFPWRTAPSLSPAPLPSDPLRCRAVPRRRQAVLPRDPAVGRSPDGDKQMAIYAQASSSAGLRWLAQRQGLTGRWTTGLGSVDTSTSV